MSVHYSVRFGMGLCIKQDDVGLDRMDDIISPSNLPEGFEAYYGGNMMDGKDVSVLIARPEHVVTLQETLDPIGDVFGVFTPQELVEYNGLDVSVLAEFAYENDVVPYIGYYIVSEVG